MNDKLSGIGDASELQKHNIAPVAHWPGIGKNLQDRYEVCVVSELKEPIDLIKNCTFFEKNDPCIQPWTQNPSKHVYSTNGVVISHNMRSSRSLKTPDLNIFGLPGKFYGYYPNWSNESYKSSNVFSWAVLKGHTLNKDGWVKLRTDDYRDTPEINFNYFNKKSDPSQLDLEAVVNGVMRARKINEKAADQIKQELIPGEYVKTKSQLREFVKKEAWGHHASCSNKMGH